MARIRAAVVVLGLVATLAAGAAACQPPQPILRTVSCPVYQPPETPQPNWPKQCGGTQ